MQKNKEHIEIFSPSGCLTEEAMRSFSAKECAEHYVVQINEHLANCEFCTLAIEGMQLFFTENTEADYQENLDILNTQMEEKLNSFVVEETTALPTRNTRYLLTFVSVAATVAMLVGLYLVIKLYVPAGMKNNQLAVMEKSKAYEGEMGDHQILPYPPADTAAFICKNPWRVTRFNAPVVLADSLVEMDVTAGKGNRYDNYISLSEEDFKMEEKPAVKSVLKDVVSPKAVSSSLEKGENTSQAYNNSPNRIVQSVESKTKQHFKDKKSAAGGVEYASKSMEVVQTSKEDETPIFTVVEEMPYYPGGESARLKFLNSNIIYPDSARAAGISGTVYVSFIIDTKGRVNTIKVVKGIGGGCDEEAIRVIKKMPNWIPGRQAGKPVNVQFTTPIRFTLN